VLPVPMINTTQLAEQRGYREAGVVTPLSGDVGQRHRQRCHALVSLDRGTMRDRDAKEKRRQVCTCRRFF
jgi:hypothetical protein